MDPKLLQPGDIIEIVDGDTVEINIPDHFCYSNRRGVMHRLSSAVVTVGEDYNGFPTDWLKGRYVVTQAYEGGGGEGHGPNDIFPDGWLIEAESLLEKHSEYSDSPRWKIKFSQSGCFSHSMPEKRAVGKAKAHWIVED